MELHSEGLLVSWVETAVAYFYVDMYTDAMAAGGAHARIWTVCAIMIPIAVTMAFQKTVWEPARHILRWASKRVHKIERGVGHVAKGRSRTPMVVAKSQPKRPVKKPGAFARIGKMIGLEVV